MRRHGTTMVLLIALVVLARLWPGLVPPTQTPIPSAVGQYVEEGLYEVDRVIDGDTLVVRQPHRDNGRPIQADPRVRVRLIGVDTPETVKPNHPIEPWGPEASDFTKQFVSGGTVRLQLDRERVDRYGRLLAYVWVDDRMLNEELVRAGLAEAKLGYNYSAAMKRRFRAAELHAQQAELGIWSKP